MSPFHLARRRGHSTSPPRPAPRRDHRRLVGLTAALSAALVLSPTAVLATDTATDDATTDAEQGPRVVAADGTSRGIDAIDPGNRVEGILALYTPDFGATTNTNEFGAEAVLVPSDEGPDRFVVEDLCTVWDFFDGACDNPGNNAIPEDGYVLSASPGGDDPRTFLRDHLAVGDVISVDLPILREAETTLDATDPTPETNPDGVDQSTGQCFPGCRGAEQLIRYTPAFGTTTGTNQFGYEVVVVDDRVVARGGADNGIPDDGYVLSGHGSRGNWLATNATIGALVTIEGDLLRVTVDVGSYVFGAERAIDRASIDLAAATDACLAIDGTTADDLLGAATADLAAAQQAAEDGQEALAVQLAQDAEAAGDRAWWATRTSRPLEQRGIWVRPEEETPAEIAATVQELADAGLTTIYLETFFQGYTIYPSQVAAEAGVEAQRPQFAGFDPLQVWIDEAHSHGLELHTWVHSFFVGNDAVGGPGPILSVHPQWAAVERSAVGADGPRPSTAEAGYYFADVSIPEARDYLLGLFTEMVTEYDVDGLHLDYIRYPISLPIDVSFSYSDQARAAFEAEHGADPYELTMDDALWETWNEWRREQVTAFVTDAHAMVRAAGDDLVLSAAVFPDRFDAEVRKLQDWAGWSQAGVIDVLTGMSFGGSPEQNAVDTTTMLDATSDATLVVTGIYSPFSALPPDTMLEQIDAVRAADAHGVALFAYNQLTSRQAAAAAAGSFREPAISPETAPVASTRVGLADLRSRVADVHAGCLDTGTRTALGSRLDQVVRTLDRASEGRGNTEAALRQAERQLDGLVTWLDGRVDADLLATQLTEELTRAASTLRYAQLR